MRGPSSYGEPRNMVSSLPLLDFNVLLNPHSPSSPNLVFPPSSDPLRRTETATQIACSTLQSYSSEPLPTVAKLPLAKRHHVQDLYSIHTPPSPTPNTQLAVFINALYNPLYVARTKNIISYYDTNYIENTIQTLISEQIKQWSTSHQYEEKIDSELIFNRIRDQIKSSDILIKPMLDWLRYLYQCLDRYIRVQQKDSEQQKLASELQKYLLQYLPDPRLPDPLDLQVLNTNYPYVPSLSHFLNTMLQSVKRQDERVTYIYRFIHSDPKKARLLIKNLRSYKQGDKHECKMLTSKINSYIKLQERSKSLENKQHRFVIPIVLPPNVSSLIDAIDHQTYLQLRQLLESRLRQYITYNNSVTILTEFILYHSMRETSTDIAISDIKIAIRDMTDALQYGLVNESSDIKIAICDMTDALRHQLFVKIISSIENAYEKSTGHQISGTYTQTLKILESLASLSEKELINLEALISEWVPNLMSSTIDIGKILFLQNSIISNDINRHLKSLHPKLFEEIYQFRPYLHKVDVCLQDKHFNYVRYEIKLSNQFKIASGITNQDEKSDSWHEVICQCFLVPMEEKTIAGQSQCYVLFNVPCISQWVGNGKENGSIKWRINAILAAPVMTGEEVKAIDTNLDRRLLGKIFI